MSKHMAKELCKPSWQQCLHKNKFIHMRCDKQYYFELLWGLLICIWLGCEMYSSLTLTHYHMLIILVTFHCFSGISLLTITQSGTWLFCHPSVSVRIQYSCIIVSRRAINYNIVLVYLVHIAIIYHFTSTYLL